MSDIDTSTKNIEDIADACDNFIDEESAEVVRALAAERDALSARCAALEQEQVRCARALVQALEQVQMLEQVFERRGDRLGLQALSTPSEEPK